MMIHAFTLRRYLQLMELRGFHADQVLAGTGVDRTRLTDRTYCVQLEQRRALISNMLTLTGTSALGLEFGRLTHISSFGAVGHVLLSSHSIWEQYRRWLQYGESLLGLPIATAMQRHDDGSWSAAYRDPLASGVEHVFGIEELISISRKIVQSSTGEPLRLKAIRLDYPAPAHASLYSEVFACPIEFGCDRVEMIAAAPFPYDCFPRPDEEFAQACISYCGRLLKEVSGPQSLAERLRSVIASRPGEATTIAQAARILGMSERTLRRRLAAEDTSFHDITQQFRREAAIDCLRNRRMRPKEVSYLLGFRHTSDFHRAFKSWTGRSVGAFLHETLSA